MARKQRDEGGGYSWMDTYGDMVTLLLCFFVLLYSMSSVNEEKWEALVRAFTSRGNDSQQLILSPPDGEGNDIAQNTGVADSDDERVNIETLPENFEELYKYIKTYVEENQMQGTVTVEKGGDNSVYIRFQDNLFFEADSEQLMPGSTGILEFIGKCIKSVEDQVLMTRVNGHTADPQIANYKVSDWRLSSGRADSVVIYFENVLGVEGKKLMSQGYGKNFPVADNATAEGRQRNRRVEMMIISNEILNNTADLNKLTNDLLGSADLFKDQMNTSGMLVPPTTAGQSTAADTAGAAASVPTDTPQSTAPADTPASAPAPTPAPPAGSGSDIPLP